MNTQDYLNRISYTGSLQPDAQALHALQIAHLRAVPFENLDIHLGRPIRLHLPSIYDKIVRRRRGGFCYELNGLFAWLLQELGFEVTLLSASDAQGDGKYGPEFDHLVLEVHCPEDAERIPWLVDVGWGDSFTSPLRLDENSPQEQGLRAYRIDRDGDFHFLWQRNYDGTWAKQYRFTLQPRSYPDFEAMCLYHQTSPQSHFTQGRICTRATPTGRISLDDDHLIITENGDRQERVVLCEHEYRSILQSEFGILV